MGAVFHMLRSTLSKGGQTLSAQAEQSGRKGAKHGVASVGWESWPRLAQGVVIPRPFGSTLPPLPERVGMGGWAKGFAVTCEGE